MEIRELSVKDLPIRVEWMNNPLIYKSMHFSVPVFLDKTREWFLKNQQCENRVDFAFCGQIGGSAIDAFGGITNIDKEVGKGETYIFTNPNVHNRGIGTEAMKLLCQYGFEVLDLNKLYAFTNEDNEASIHLHLKVGYEIEGCLRQEYRDSDGNLKDRIYLGLLRKNHVK